MRVLGIDCGSECTGYGVIDSDGRRHRLVVCGAIRTSPQSSFPARLEKIHAGLAGVLQANQPEAVAVENVFYAVNVRTALKLAHVRGVALLAAAEAGLAVGEYSPLEIKGSVVGFGRATKSQVPSHECRVGSLAGLTDSVDPFDASRGQPESSQEKRPPTHLAASVNELARQDTCWQPTLPSPFC